MAITVTATEFQQNVGKYFDLAEKGQEIHIQKLRPKDVSFALKKDKNERKNSKKNFENMYKNILESKITFGDTKDSVKYQKQVRS